VKKLEIKVNKLNEVMELVKPVVPKKPSVKTIACLSLANGKAVATDLETMVIANVPEAQDPMLLPYYSIAEMLKYVPGSETLKIELKGKMVSLVWKDGSASYPTEDFADFPILPELTTRAEGLIDGDVLIPTMIAALPYTTEDSTRPMLSGITVVLGNPIEVAAGDGFRMCHKALGLSFPLEEKIIIPRQGVAILDHVFAKTPRTPPATAPSLIKVVTAKRQLHMSVIGDNKLRLDFGTSASVVINLISGKPPEWLALIPKGEPMLQSQIFAPQLEAAVKRVRIIAKEGTDAVRMQFANGKLKVSAKGNDQEISSTIDTVHTQGEATRIAINQKYVLGYLSGKQGIITFSKYTENGPAVFEDQQSLRMIVMPMVVAWGDEPAAVKEEPQAESADTETNEVSNTEESESSGEEETSEIETMEEQPMTE
jgi:DNA polymerase III sliding clamp (beta) subunit (PCNA family)